MTCCIRVLSSFLLVIERLVLILYSQGQAAVYQRRGPNEDPIEVSKLGASDYFGKCVLSMAFAFNTYISESM